MVQRGASGPSVGSVQASLRGLLVRRLIKAMSPGVSAAHDPASLGPDTSNQENHPHLGLGQHRAHRAGPGRARQTPPLTKKGEQPGRQTLIPEGRTRRNPEADRFRGVSLHMDPDVRSSARKSNQALVYLEQTCAIISGVWAGSLAFYTQLTLGGTQARGTRMQ